MAKSMMIYLDCYEMMEVLTDAQQGRVFMSAFRYQKTGRMPEDLDTAEMVAFMVIKKGIDENNAKYRAKVERMKQNAQSKNDIDTKSERNRDDIAPDTDTDTVTDTKKDKESIVGQRPTHPPYSEIIDYLNKKTGASFKADSKQTRWLIKARWNEGYSLEDFKKVIDNKHNEWKDDGKMLAYLRPPTLFGSKFESYLNQPRAKPHAAKGAFFHYEQRDDDLSSLEAQLDRQFAAAMTS